MARGRDIQVPAGPSLDIQPPPALIPFVYQPAPRPSRSRSTSPVLVLRRDSAPPFREPFWTPETLHHDPPLQPRPRARSPLRRQPRPEPPVYQGTALVIPEHTRTPRQNHDMHDAPPSQRARTSGPQRRPSVRSLGPFLPESLYDERPPAAPAHLRGGDSPSGSTGWYTQRRPDSEGVMPPPGVIDGQPCQPGASAQGPAYAPMPPGPTVVQLPLLFDTLVAILREHRHVQLTTVDQQRELMRYMSGLNDWLARDLQDRQAELRSVAARVNQLREDLGRLGVGAGPGVPMPQPQPQPQPQTGPPTGVGGFIVPPIPPAPGGSVPPVVSYPTAFFPQGGPQPPAIPGMDRSPSAQSLVITEAPARRGMLISDLSQYMGPTGPVLPTGMPYGEYHLTGPNQYVYTEEPDERVIPSTPFSGSRSPLPVPWRGTMFVSPSLGHDSRCSTPAQESYHPPHSPGALPVTPGDVPNVIPVDPSVGGPPPHQTIINIPQIGVPPPGHMVEPGIPVQSSPPAHPDVAVQPSLQGVPTRPIVTHPPFPGPSVPVSESIHVPSRASSRTCTYYAPMPSECGVRDRRPSFSMEDAPEPPRRYPSSASAMGGDRRSPQRMPSRGDAPMLPADLDSSPSSPSSGTLTYFDSSRRSESASHRDSQTTTNGSGSSHGHLLARLVSLEKEVRKINAAAAVTTERPEAETSCANVAERRVLDYFHGMRIAVENRHHAEQESARLREELKLHKLQLEEVQKESQNVLKQVDSLRKEAEAEAVRARITARKLQEEMLVMLAREEGRRGNQERLSMVRRIGYVEEHHEGDENIPELGKATLDEERNDPRSHIQLRSAASTRQQPIRSEWAPPIRTFDTSSYVPPLPVRVHTPSHEHRTPSPPRDLDEPETIHPIPIRPSLIISSQPSVPIDDGWIPRADSGTSYIRLPPPDELRQPTPPSPSSVATEVQDRRATQQSPPTPVSPPVRSRDYVYQPSVPPPISRGHTPSIASRTSTHVSQYDVVNECPGSSLRNEIYVGRVRSGSQPSRESTSQNEHRDQDRHHSSRTEVESIADQWRADDAASPPRNPPRLLTPSAVSRPHQPSRIYYPQPGFHYRAWKLVVPRPSGMSRIKE